MDRDADRRTVTVTENGTQVGTYRIATDQSILVGAGESALGLRYGCRDGTCVRCIGRLNEGAVSYLREPVALSEAQRDAGFVLLCIARPETDCRVEIGRNVLEDAFPELWRPDSGFR